MQQRFDLHNHTTRSKKLVLHRSTLFSCFVVAALPPMHASGAVKNLQHVRRKLLKLEIQL
jgi:hypothetical protein